MGEDFEYDQNRYLRVSAVDVLKTSYKLNDGLFKYIFGRAQCKNILKAFLNSVFDGTRQIEDLTYSDRERSPAQGQKGSRFDVIAVGQDGKTFHVEVQTNFEKFFFERCVHYASSSYVEQLASGRTYNTLNPVFLVGLMDFACFDDGRDEYSWYRLIEERTRKPGPDTIELHLFELPKFRNSKRRLTRKIDYWLSYLTSTKKGSDPEMQKLTKYEPEIGDAISMEKDFFADTQLRLHYIREELDRLHTEQERERREREFRETLEALKADKEAAEADAKAAKADAKAAKADAKAAKADAKIVAKVAKAEGIEEGREEGKIKVAQNLLKTGMDLENIAMLSELPVEKIRELERP